MEGGGEGEGKTIGNEQKAIGKDFFFSSRGVLQPPGLVKKRKVYSTRKSEICKHHDVRATYAEPFEF